VFQRLNVVINQNVLLDFFIRTYMIRNIRHKSSNEENKEDQYVEDIEVNKSGISNEYRRLALFDSKLP
jgi:hypothetical protein